MKRMDNTAIEDRILIALETYVSEQNCTEKIIRLHQKLDLLMKRLYIEKATPITAHFFMAGRDIFRHSILPLAYEDDPIRLLSLRLVSQTWNSCVKSIPTLFLTDHPALDDSARGYLTFFNSIQVLEISACLIAPGMPLPITLRKLSFTRPLERDQLFQGFPISISTLVHLTSLNYNMLRCPPLLGLEKLTTLTELSLSYVHEALDLTSLRRLHSLTLRNTPHPILPSDPWKLGFLDTNFEEYFLDRAYTGKGRFKGMKWSYEGEWIDGLPWGQGTMREDEEDSEYRGGFCQGKKEGWGSYRNAYGCYEGEWKENRMSGMGAMTVYDWEDTWEGEWHNDVHLETGVAFMENQPRIRLEDRIQW